jgi:hypothetical protein
MCILVLEDLEKVIFNHNLVSMCYFEACFFFGCITVFCVHTFKICFGNHMTIVCLLCFCR